MVHHIKILLTFIVYFKLNCENNKYLHYLGKYLFNRYDLNLFWTSKISKKKRNIYYFVQLETSTTLSNSDEKL
jgi:hypothetical protein